MSKKKKLGEWGERVAALALEAKGFDIVARNWHCVYGEIDLVARHGEWLVFIEVKTRRGRRMGTPEMAINSTKASRLTQAAHAYLLEHDIEDPLWRVDMVAVELDERGKLLRCQHYKNALSKW